MACHIVLIISFSKIISKKQQFSQLMYIFVKEINVRAVSSQLEEFSSPAQFGSAQRAEF